MQELSGEAIILNLLTERYYGLDAVGTRMWQALTSSASLQDALDVLLSEFDIDVDTLQRDMAALIGKLADQGLLEIHRD